MDARRGTRVWWAGMVLPLLSSLVPAAMVPLVAHGAQDAPAVPVASAAQAILGNWLTGKRDGIIQISQGSDGLYQGRIVGGSGPHRVDEKNPDPAKRGAPLLGQVILRDMKYDGNGRWSGGSIYDPDSGHTYRCRLELLAPDRLRARGFLGVSLIGRSQTWTRYTGSSMVLGPPS